MCIIISYTGFGSTFRASAAAASAARGKAADRDARRGQGGGRAGADGGQRVVDGGEGGGGATSVWGAGPSTGGVVKTVIAVGTRGRRRRYGACHCIPG